MATTNLSEPTQNNMKILLIIFLLIHPFYFLSAQHNYSESIQQGDEAFSKQQFKTAIHKYFAAEAFDPSKKEEVKKRVGKVFDKIEALREEAETAGKRERKAKTAADSARNRAIRSEQQTKKALEQSNRLINAFYFYEGKFALAYGTDTQQHNIYYFIDKNGLPVQKLGQWAKAELFDETGFAQVKKEEINQLREYLVDTFGHAYRSSSKISGLGKETRALYLSGHQFTQYLDKILPHQQLLVLLLYYVNSNLPTGISRLKNLKVLYAAACALDSLPNEIGELPKLTELNVNNNHIKQLPASIGNLVTLRLLHLGNNRLTLFPEAVVTLQQLRYLNLSYNRLTAIPESIGNLKQLELLDLRGNSLSLAEQEKIKNLLPGLKIRF
jgi:Leucine rich repeat